MPAGMPLECRSQLSLYFEFAKGRQTIRGEVCAGESWSLGAVKSGEELQYSLKLVQLAELACYMQSFHHLNNINIHFHTYIHTYILYNKIAALIASIQAFIMLLFSFFY